MSPETEEQAVTATPLPNIDLDAIQPVPVATVTIAGQQYEVLSMLDLPIGQFESLLGEGAQARGEGGWKGQVDAARKQIKAVVPGIPDEVLAGLTSRQIAELSNQVIGVFGPVPPRKEE